MVLWAQMHNDHPIINKEHEILKRIQMGNKCYYALSNLFRLRILLKKLKVQLYITLIRLMVLYGAQGWIVKKTEKSRLRSEGI